MLADQGGRFGDHDACLLHSPDFAGCITLTLLDYGTSVTHPAFGRGSEACDEAHHWLVLLVVLLQPVASQLFRLSSDFADHYDALSLGVHNKLLKNIDEVGTIEGVPSNTDDGGLSEACLSSLINSLIGECSGSADNTDLSSLVDVSGHDADLAFIGLDDTWTVGTDYSGLFLGTEGVLDLDHIVLGNSCVNG